MRLVWFIVGAVCALATAQVARVVLRHYGADGSVPARAVATAAQARSLATPAGEDFDGEVLSPSDERVLGNPSPLTIRRSCAWGVPGGNRYRGTVAQALSAARLPVEVVQQISDMAERGWTRGQVEISRAGIRSLDGLRDFGTSARAMAFGNSLCFEMRVNFVPGHVEYAALYEADDRQGRTYSVMVPYVCQNVAVLGARGEIGENGNGVPEPAGWALALLGLGLLAWSRSRRRRRGAP